MHSIYFWVTGRICLHFLNGIKFHNIIFPKYVSIETTGVRSWKLNMKIARSI